MTVTRSNTCAVTRDCSGLEGDYAEGPCQAQFCRCWDGFGWLESCMDPLKFDADTGACLWEEEVAGCGATTTTTTGCFFFFGFSQGAVKQLF